MTEFISQVLPAMGVAIVTGVVSAIATVRGVMVHIEWLRESTTRAHSRIDQVEREVMRHRHSG